VSTGLEILAKIQATDRIWRNLVGLRITTLVIDEWTSLKAKSRQDVHDDNYFFGSALQHHKHVDAKKYHEMGQRNKTAYRERFTRRVKSSPPKYKTLDNEVLKTYHALNVAASLGA
jgi:hypothetical protein